MADAWLGLHRLGVQQDEAVAAMAAAEARFGEERQRARRLLQSRFMIGHYVSFSLETHVELWAAVAAMHLRREEHDLAERALSRLHPAETVAQFLGGRLAYLRGDREAAIRSFLPLFDGDVYLETEARLLSGVALAQMSALAPARDHLSWVLRQTAVPNARAEAHFYLGLVARAAGDETEAADQWHRAYALRPDFPGVVEALADPTYALVMAEAVGRASQPEPAPARGQR